MKQYPQRKSPRLQGYDYSQSGAYFVTICTHLRQHLFGRVEDGEMNLSDVGGIVSERWYALPEHHPNIELDSFVVMPNHVHGIIILLDHDDVVGTMPALSEKMPALSAHQNNMKSGSLSAVIGSYKSSASRHIRKAHSQYRNETIWQSRYHDHIIRNESDLNRIRQYVQTNPARWESDTFYNT